VPVSKPYPDGHGQCRKGGLTATRIIRKFDGGARLPIIAITAFGKSYYMHAIEAGCDDLINKPVDTTILKSILNQYSS
jgi:CheY-like chemotaxis protein